MDIQSIYQSKLRTPDEAEITVPGPKHFSAAETAIIVIPHGITVGAGIMDHQQVINRIAEIEKVSGRYAGWKVGDMTQAVTDGNFE